MMTNIFVALSITDFQQWLEAYQGQPAFLMNLLDFCSLFFFC